MAQVKATFEEVPEIIAIAKKLIAKHTDVFSGIDITKIKAVAVNNKERSEKKPIYDVVSPKPPASDDCAFKYYIVVYLKDWVDMPEIIRNRLVTAALLRIDPDEDGKLKPFDVKDRSTMIRTFGMNYLDTEDGLDPLADKIEWKQ